MNKKSQIFTVLAILILLLMFVSFEVYSSIRERQAIKTRVSSMESFLNSIEDNLQRQMYISGFRIIFLAESEITAHGAYINVNDFFNEAFFNGTVNGASNQTILYGVTYKDIIDSINKKAEKISVNVSLENSSINISQEDPWNVKFTLTSDFVMKDKRNLAQWQKKQIIIATIPINGFIDPIFIVKTRASVARKINSTIYEGHYADGSDVSNLSVHFSKGMYAANSDAPSFLKRLEGNLNSDIYGIESFVDTTKLPSDLVDNSKSVVDHEYFSPVGNNGNSVAGMPAWFKLDDSHKTRYGV